MCWSGGKTTPVEEADPPVELPPLVKSKKAGCRGCQCRTRHMLLLDRLRALERAQQLRSGEGDSDSEDTDVPEDGEGGHDIERNLATLSDELGDPPAWYRKMRLHHLEVTNKSFSGDLEDMRPGGHIPSGSPRRPCLPSAPTTARIVSTIKSGTVSTGSAGSGGGGAVCVGSTGSTCTGGGCGAAITDSSADYAGARGGGEAPPQAKSQPVQTRSILKPVVQAKSKPAPRVSWRSIWLSSRWPKDPTATVNLVLTPSEPKAARQRNAPPRDLHLHRQVRFAIEK